MVMGIPEPIVLDGCNPTPLASYLKALGILRVLSLSTNNVTGNAADPRARGFWEAERFHLWTSLSRDDVLRFFLEDYAPSPIVGPWNGRAGFLEGDGQEASTRTGADLMRRFENSPAPRFSSMRRTIERLRENIELDRLNQLRARAKALKKEQKSRRGEERKSLEEKIRVVQRQEKQSKRALLPTLRSETEPEHVSYVDACYVLSSEETPMPLLGSGGNDGSRDFGVNFADELARLFSLEDGLATEPNKALLESAFLGDGRLDTRGTMGQFSPGQGGSNATTGYEGSNPLNPWDIVLAMEGTITFAGAMTRSWGTEASRAAFPFTFEPVGAGAGSLSSEDPNRPRGEIWTPLWRKPATFTEVKAIFSEGRLTLAGRSARNGLDAARSVAQIGLARGINSFERYSLIQPDAKQPYQATPLGRIATPARPRGDLIGDLEFAGWLDRARRLAGNRKTAPARARHAKRNLEDALFQMTDAAQSSEGTRNALIALGRFVGWLATNPKVREEINPPPRLSMDWIRQADDGTPEFRVATALAGLGLPKRASSDQSGAKFTDGASASGQIFTSPSKSETRRGAAQPSLAYTIPMAAHFAPIDTQEFFVGSNLRRQRAWSAVPLPAVVWNAGNLVSNMIAVLGRRLIEATIHGSADKPLSSAAVARTEDIATFIEGDFDDARCGALLAGLIWTTPTWLRSPKMNDGIRSKPSPLAYAALKPLFSPDAALFETGFLDDGVRLPIPPGLLVRLRGGSGNRNGDEINEAVRAALSRVRASGVSSPFDPVSSDSLAASRIGVGIRADRLAASLLIPIGTGSLKRLLTRVWPDVLQQDDLPKEGTSHAS